MMIQAVLSNPSHPEYGVATIPFPIPHDQYAHCMELLAASMSMLNALILAVASKKGADISSTFAELDHVWDRFGIFGKVEDE